MSYTSHEIAFLQDLVAKGSGQKAASSTSRSLGQHYGMGQHIGSRFTFTEADSARARQMLVNASIPIEPPSTGLRRAEAARNNPAREKAGTLAPHENSIAVKVAHGHCDLDGHPVATQGYQVLTLEQALNVRADVLLVVENLESLRFLERNRWIDYEGKAVLAVFRGDRTLRTDVVARFIESSSAPVWAYFDFDPAGLGMSAKLPRLQRILLPPEAALASAARNANQVHLYADQVGQWSRALTSDKRPMVLRPWALLRQLRVGLAQELMDIL
ncbi:DUF7281 domain-containing protein [Hydrogenophaga sp. R2]|uniref:DUF7281 domain-containing protein n=1 Tax=Hydrogenophaga sp. R2 TaxID=3132827 RepID=UPI003CF9A92D